MTRYRLEPLKPFWWRLMEIFDFHCWNFRKLYRKVQFYEILLYTITTTLSLFFRLILLSGCKTGVCSQLKVILCIITYNKMINLISRCIAWSVICYSIFFKFSGKISNIKKISLQSLKFESTDWQYPTLEGHQILLEKAFELFFFGNDQK